MLSLILSAGVYTWFFMFNKALVFFEAGVSNYLITTGAINQPCVADPCIIELKPGQHIISFSKEGYFSEEKIINIQSRSNQTVSFSPSKIPQLVVSSQIPPDDSLMVKKERPSSLKNISIQSSAWNSEGDQFLFIDESDDGLKVWANQSTKLITRLSSHDIQFFWSPDNQWALGYQDNNLYSINLLKASRQKIVLDFYPQVVLWSKNNTDILLTDENRRLHRFNVNSLSIDSIADSFDLTQARFLSADRLIYFEGDEADERLMEIYLSNGSTRPIISSLDFSPVEIRSYQGQIYLKNQNNIWYLLEE